MQRVFPTEPNPETILPKPKIALKASSTDLQSSKLDFQKYIDTLEMKLDTATIRQMSILKNKHQRLNQSLLDLQMQKYKMLKDSLKNQNHTRESFQAFLMKDIEKFKNHKEFFQYHFKRFSSQLNDEIQKRDKLKLCANQLKNSLKEIKRTQIKKVTQSVILPSICHIKTSQTLKTTQPTQRSIRMSTELVQNMSPVLKRMGGSQPVLGSRIYQAIKAQSKSSKKLKRKQNTNLLKSLLQQRYIQKRSLQLSAFQKVLFQRRNFLKLMQFFQCVELF